MRDETIRAGDLIVFVNCEPCDCSISKIRRVLRTGIKISKPVMCPECGSMTNKRYSQWAYIQGRTVNGYAPLSWLRKLHPDATEHTTETEKELSCH